MSEDTQEKVNTKEYFVCSECKKKLEQMELGSSSDLFGFGGTKKALYCDNKQCDRFGLLTVAGIKKTE